MFGELNVFADAASRNRPEVIGSLTLQLGIVSRRIPLPPAALVFFDSVRNDAIAARHTTAAQLAGEQQRSAFHPSTYTSDGPGRSRPSDSEAVGSSPAKRISFLSLPFAYVDARVRTVSEHALQAVVAHGRAGHDHRATTSTTATSLELGSLQQTSTTPIGYGGKRDAPDPDRSFAGLQQVFSNWHESSSRLLPHMTVGSRLGGGMQSAEGRLGELVEASRLGPPLAGSTPASQLESLGLHQAQSSLHAALSPLAQSIMMDSSAQALRPSDPQMLLEYDALVGAAVQASVSAGTAKKNALSMKRWSAFAALWGTPPLREDDLALLLTNAFLFASFLIWLAREVRGKGGRALAKPSTLMSDLYGVKRYHHLHGRRCDAFLLVKAVLKSITNQYAARYGPEALQPIRSEPFSGSITHARHSIVASRLSRVGFRIVVLPQCERRHCHFISRRASKRGPRAYQW